MIADPVARIVNSLWAMTTKINIYYCIFVLYFFSSLFSITIGGKGKLFYINAFILCLETDVQIMKCLII